MGGTFRFPLVSRVMFKSKLSSSTGGWICSLKRKAVQIPRVANRRAWVLHKRGKVKVTDSQRQQSRHA